MNKTLEKSILNIYNIENAQLKEREIFRILKTIDSYNLEEYENNYIKGYLWYRVPTRSNERNKMIEFYLTKSILNNQKYLYAKAYLGYLYFDNKEYHKLVSLFKNLNFSYFEEKGQLWKSLKLQELLAVSKLYLTLSIDEDLLAEFLSLISSYLSLPINEVAIPKELVTSVINNQDKIGILEIAKNTYLLVNSLNFKDYFDEHICIKLKEIIELSSTPKSKLK